jgi:hypothetical protein
LAYFYFYLIKQYFFYAFGVGSTSGSGTSHGSLSGDVLGSEGFVPGSIVGVGSVAGDGGNKIFKLFIIINL